MSHLVVLLARPPGRPLATATKLYLDRKRAASPSTIVHHRHIVQHMKHPIGHSDDGGDTTGLS